MESTTGRDYVTFGEEFLWQSLRFFDRFCRQATIGNLICVPTYAIEPIIISGT